MVDEMQRRVALKSRGDHASVHIPLAPRHSGWQPARTRGAGSCTVSGARGRGFACTRSHHRRRKFRITGRASILAARSWMLGTLHRQHARSMRLLPRLPRPEEGVVGRGADAKRMEIPARRPTSLAFRRSAISFPAADLFLLFRCGTLWVRDRGAPRWAALALTRFQRVGDEVLSPRRPRMRRRPSSTGNAGNLPDFISLLFGDQSGGQSAISHSLDS